jgi:putative transposase
MDKFKNKYRISSHRKPNWDYSAEALYFLTIVTQNRECNLGEIVNTDGHIYLSLSNFGKIVEDEWYKSFEIRNELILHEFVLMPNHLHTIVEIYNENRGDIATVVSTHPTD